jgi:hypothetical protein
VKSYLSIALLYYFGNFFATPPQWQWIPEARKLQNNNYFTKSANEIGHFGLWKTKLRNCVEEDNLKNGIELVSNT